MTKTFRLALVGFGNVAQGFAQILSEQGDALAARFGARFEIAAVADPVRGSLLNEANLSPARLIDAAGSAGGLNALPGGRSDLDALAMIQSVTADALVELSFTNLTTGEPATSYIAAALTRGMHAVTTNKGPVALHYQRLSELARAHGVQLGVEGTVMSGTPALRLGREILASAGIKRIAGILNGTTNYILTQMEGGQSYADALAAAQAQGYAEADPTGDVEGFDAAAKVAILAQLVMGVPCRPDQVTRNGITAISASDVARASAAGERWKLVGSVEHAPDGSLRASVQPMRLPGAHPLAGVGGATNAICYTTDLLGDVTLIGAGAGRLQTGAAVLQDLLAILTHGEQ